MGNDANSTEPNRDAHVAALKRERAGYVSNGNDERLAAVDAELERLGGGATDVDASPVERAVASAPERSESVKAKPARKRPTSRKAKAKE
jgi:hypothetical protein